MYSETLMQDSQIKSDWLVNNAVIAFFSGLIIAQTPRSPDGRTELVIGIDIPSVPTWWTNSAIALLLAMSVVLVLASVVPILRRCTLRLSTPLVPTLEFLTWLAFSAGFAQSLQELPKDQWWSHSFIYGGLAFMGFLFLRFVNNLVTVMRGQCTAILDNIPRKH